MVTKWDIVGKVSSSSYRRKVLSKLSESRKTPKQLSKELNINISHISRAINELYEMNLVICLTPNLRKGRIYSITKLGKSVLNNLKGN